MTIEREFHHKVLKVEERYRPQLTEEAAAKLGAVPGADGGAEGKYEPTEVSTGWWVVLDGLPIALRFGSGKPDIEAGDTLVLVARTIKKPGAALVVVPKPPPPPLADVEVARKVWLDSLHPDIAAKIAEFAGTLP